MRYALLMHYREPGDGEISEAAIEAAKEAFGAYGHALESAGVLLSADVLQPTAATTSVTRREGGLQVQDGAFADEGLVDERRARVVLHRLVEATVAIAGVREGRAADELPAPPDARNDAVRRPEIERERVPHESAGDPRRGVQPAWRSGRRATNRRGRIRPRRGRSRRRGRRGRGFPARTCRAA